MFGGMCSVIGRWSEFKFCFVIVVNVYNVGFCVLIKKPFIELVLVQL